MKSHFWVLRFAVAFLAALITPLAFGQSTYSTDANVNQMASTTCPSGEVVVLNGNLHFTYSFTTDATTGINTYQINATSNMPGVGQATQTSYAGSAAFAYSYLTAASPAQIAAQLQYPLNSQGSVPNLMLAQTVNITVDTSGNINASAASSSTSCAGN
jgi:exopolysaccharide biosynthesis protein